jgi:uncharacterized protein (TIGR03663 family)
MRYRAAALAIIVLSALMRLISLSDRPMHTDEAVHAFKFAQLLENDIYIYDKNEYHGPSLYYLNLIPAWIRSQNDLASLDEITLRIVPFAAGLLLILLVFLLVKSLGWSFVLMTALLLGISPALVFFSRYYIHEMLLILFNAGALISLFRYSRTGRPGWIVLAGLFSGFMVATKETWIILAAVEIMALAIVQFRLLRSREERKRIWSSIRCSHLALFFIAAAVIAVVLFSSFFKNPQGIMDSVKAYSGYFTRATGNGDHIYPWYYYFRLISLNSCDSCWFRADAWLLAAGIAGMVLSIVQRPSLTRNHAAIQFTALTTLLLATVFSAIPYKTPWNILAFYTSNIFLAAWFLMTFPRTIKNKWIKKLYFIPLGFIVLHLLWQSGSDSFKYPDHPCNPYVYAHPDKDVLTILKEVEQVAATAPEGKNIFIEVIVPGDGYWPLPWYFRSFPNTGWWSEVDLSSPAAPLIICAPECSGELTKKLFEVPEPGKRYLYIPILDKNPELRPGVKVSLFLRKDYWDRYRAGQKS